VGLPKCLTVGCRMKSSSSLSQKKGFTILEVMIALVILSGALGAILSIQGSAINASTRAQEMNTVVLLAKNKMIEFEFEHRAKGLLEIPEETKGQFEAPHDLYRFEIKLKKRKDLELIEQLFSQAGQSKNKSDPIAAQLQSIPQAFSAQITEQIKRLEDRFREVSLKIKWNRSGREQEYELGQYFTR
jgi:prepilin-type N-terminal cleavage/methylation domain-containing protein